MNLTSATNPSVKQAIRLRAHRERRETGLFLIEGAREVDAAIEAGVEIETLFVAPGISVTAPGGSATHRTRTLEVTDEVFAKMSYRENPDGVLAIARCFDLSLQPPQDGDALVLVADRIEKPGNLGAMIRTASAVGASAVIACDPATDVFNPNVVRASVGTLFSTPVRAAPADEVRAWLRAHSIATVVTSPAAEMSLWDLRAPSRCAVVIGAEHDGVDDAWVGAADHLVHIPMRGAPDSLNAAMSAGIVLYEIARQRALANVDDATPSRAH